MTPLGYSFDWERGARVGVPEAVLCGHKTPEQIDAIARAASERGERLLLTRLTTDAVDALSAPVKGLLDYDGFSRTGIVGGMTSCQDSGIGLVAAGTSDLAVLAEAERTLAFLGHRATTIADIGVAGLWRVERALPSLRRFKIIIAAAGMEGALFSVLAGLVRAPVIAVPCAVGYGVAEGGRVALDAALSACAPGVLVVNIDNGFGAATAAVKMLNAFAPAVQSA